MRPIVRARVVPPTLQPNGAGGIKAAANHTAHGLDDRDAMRFPAHWNKEDVRGTLYATQWRVCAYCGRTLPGNDRGDVEHYRPKADVTGNPTHGGYWWLAYELSNYMLSCGICNSSRKGNKFPLRPRARRVEFATKGRLGREARLLFDPASDPLDDWISIDWENVTMVPVRPAGGLSRTEKLQVESSLEFFRINRDRSLIDERREVLDLVTTAIEEGRRDDATRLAVRYSPQSAVARAVLRDVDASLLPSRETELQWLLAQVFHELDLLLDILEQFPDDARSKIEVEETLWALSALLVDPPTGDAAPIRDGCDRNGSWTACSSGQLSSNERDVCAWGLEERARHASASFDGRSPAAGC